VSCTVDYTFSPTTLGEMSEMLVVSTDVPSTGTIDLSGTGVQGSLTISPTDLDFGGQLVGTTSSALSVTLENVGTASLDVSVLDAPTAPFMRAGGTCAGSLPITLGVGESCSLDFTYAPSVPGPSSQTLTVTTSALGSGAIGLTGNGVTDSIFSDQFED